MKKIFFIGALLFTVLGLKSQEYKPFKLGIHLGYVSAEDSDAGALFAIEPGYRILDEFAINLRLESAAWAKDIEGTSAEASANVSATVNGVFYLLDTRFRPFVGAGAGWFVPGKIETDEDSPGGNTGGIDQDGTFGFYPRVGFDFGHFNLIIDYNILKKTTGEFTTTQTVSGQQVDVTTKTELDNSYLGIKLGFTIGGGN